MSLNILNTRLTSIVCKNSDIYFKAKDVADALGYTDFDQAIRKHVWEEDKFEWCTIKDKASGMVSRISEPVSNTPCPPVRAAVPTTAPTVATGAATFASLFSHLFCFRKRIYYLSSLLLVKRYLFAKSSQVPADTKTRRFPK